MVNIKINFRKLTEARYEHGLSVSELSILTGLTEMQISELENGEEGKAFVEHEHRIDCVKRIGPLDCNLIIIPIRGIIHDKIKRITIEEIKTSKDLLRILLYHKSSGS